MLQQEMAQWFDHYLPAIQPGFGPEWPCWIARMKTRTAEHNPPFYWLGRALDLMYAHGLEATVRARLVALHGAEACPGDERDERVQRVLSEACAFAWTATRLGVPRVEPARPGGSITDEAVRLWVPDHDTYVLPARLRPHPTARQVIADVAEAAVMAADLLPGRGRVLYLDMWYERGYPATVGYDLELTEPIQAALRHYCDEVGIGHVFTRPFQWGNPVAQHY